MPIAETHKADIGGITLELPLFRADLRGLITLAPEMTRAIRPGALAYMRTRQAGIRTYHGCKGGGITWQNETDEWELVRLHDVQGDKARVWLIGWQDHPRNRPVLCDLERLRILIATAPDELQSAQERALDEKRGRH